MDREHLPAHHRAPDAPSDQPPPGLDLTPFTPLIGSLGLEFLTADLARRADRTWQLIELGDGQSATGPPLPVRPPS